MRTFASPRTLLILVPVAALAVVLGGLQAVASLALRDDALAPAWMRGVPAGVARMLAQPPAELPLPPALRLVLARHAVERGDVGEAQAYAAHLPESSDRLALAGEIAQASGNQAEALRDYLAAGDLAAVENRAAALARAGDLRGALALEGLLIARLGDDPRQAGALAEAQFELGRLEERSAYALAVGAPARHAAEVRSGAAYARAVALAPLKERYLLEYGNQLLNLGRLDDARVIFARARTLDPGGLEPLLGFGEVAFRRGARDEALQYLAQVEAIDTNDAAVRRFARKLGR